MRPGTKVDQEAISAALGVSRSPVREAVILLGTEGLLTLLPRRGAIVAHITREDVIDHYELYGLVSGRAAAAAALSLSDGERTKLREIHSRFVPSSGVDLSGANGDFHRLINRAAPARTRWLLRLLEKTVPSRYYEFASGWDAQAVGHHREILESILSGDAERARAAMEYHLHCSGEVAADELARRGFWDDGQDHQGST